MTEKKHLLALIVNTSGTVAESIDAVIDGLKRSGRQHGVTYNIRKNVVVGILDNNADKDSADDYEQFEKTLSPFGVEMRRVRDGKYDWWITIWPAKDAETASEIMAGIVGLDKK